MDESLVTMLRPDPTFYPLPKMAMQALPEEHAYVVLLNPDALAVMEVDPDSSTYQQIVGRVELNVGDEVHHFGWNAGSFALCPYAPHLHVERRYLLVPGLRSSRIHIRNAPRSRWLVREWRRQDWRRPSSTPSKKLRVADPCPPLPARENSIR